MPKKTKKRPTKTTPGVSFGDIPVPVGSDGEPVLHSGMTMFECFAVSKGAPTIPLRELLK